MIKKLEFQKITLDEKTIPIELSTVSYEGTYSIYLIKKNCGLDEFHRDMKNAWKKHESELSLNKNIIGPEEIWSMTKSYLIDEYQWIEFLKNSKKIEIYADLSYYDGFETKEKDKYERLKKKS